MGNALKWFPDKRGLAAGLTAAGFGAGSALTVIPIQSIIAHQGFQSTFLYFGLGQGLIICLCALFLRAPQSGHVREAALISYVIQSRRHYGPTEIIGNQNLWIGASLTTLFVGLIMWQASLLF